MRLGFVWSRICHEAATLSQPGPAVTSHRRGRAAGRPRLKFHTKRTKDGGGGGPEGAREK